MPTPLLAGDEGNINLFDVQRYMGVVTFGAASITSQIGRPTVVTRNSAGNYSVTFPQPYNALVAASFTLRDPSGAIPSVCVVTNNIATTGIVIFEVRNSGGTAVDPPSGDLLFWELSVSTNPRLNVSF